MLGISENPSYLTALGLGKDQMQAMQIYLLSGDQQVPPLSKIPYLESWIIDHDLRTVQTKLRQILFRPLN